MLMYLIPTIMILIQKDGTKNSNLNNYFLIITQGDSIDGNFLDFLQSSMHDYFTACSLKIIKTTRSNVLIFLNSL